MRRILLIKPSSLGDVVHALPAAAALRRQWPEAEIDWLINDEWAPLLENHPCRVNPLLFPRRQFRSWRAAIDFLRWRRRTFRGRKYDLTLDYQGLFRSALIGRLTRHEKFFGLDEAREGARFLYQRAAKTEGAVHAVDRLKRLTTLAGANPDPVEFSLPQGKKPEGIVPEKYILVHPFSRGEGKSLPRAAIRQLCDELDPWPVVLAGREPRHETEASAAADFINRTTLPELLWLLQNAHWTLSVDSGPMHLAAAVNSRLLAIHTWSDPRKVGPYNKACSVWKAGRIASRDDFSAQEAAATREPSHEDLQNISRWILEAAELGQGVP